MLEGKAAGHSLVGSINELYLMTISAYGVAVKNGFVGTEQEWLESLQGKSAQIYVGSGDMPVGYAVQIDPTVPPYDYVQTVNGVKPDENGNVVIAGDGGLLANEVEELIEQAINNLPPVGISAEEAQGMIDSTVSKIDMLTESEVQTMINNSLKNVGGLSAAEVQAMIDASLANLPTAEELPSAEEVSF